MIAGWKRTHQETSDDEFEVYWEDRFSTTKKVRDVPPSHPILSQNSLPWSEIYGEAKAVIASSCSTFFTHHEAGLISRFRGTPANARSILGCAVGGPDRVGGRG